MGAACCIPSGGGGGATKPMVDADGIVLQRAEKAMLKNVGSKYGLPPERVEKLVAAFKKVDLDKGGTIEFSEFIEQFGIKKGPLANSMWQTYDVDSNGELDFGEFVEALAATLVLKSEVQRTEWAFNLYDLNKDGIVSQSELKQSLGDPNTKGTFTKEDLEAFVALVGGSAGGGVDHKQFQTVFRPCYSMLYPAFHLHDKLKTAVFGTAVKTKDPNIEEDLKTARKAARGAHVKGFKEKASLERKSSMSSTDSRGSRKSSMSSDKGPSRKSSMSSDKGSRKGSK